MSTANSKQGFIPLFEYEIQNRSLALTITGRAAEAFKKTENAEFWQAYHGLELVNQERFTPFAVKYSSRRIAAFTRYRH